MSEFFMGQCHGRVGTVVRWIAIASIFSGSIFTSVLSFAQEKYPAKPINFLLGYPPGGAGELSSRPLLEAASKSIGQPFIILNKPGSGGAVAVALLKNEKPDGYTIGLLTPGSVLSQHLRKMTYDTSKDFTPIIHFGQNQYGLVVRSDSPWNTFKEFVDYAKANPGKIRYSSSGVGTPDNIVMEQLALNEKIKMAHIPFDGGPAGITALLGGHVDVSSSSTVFKQYVIAGQLRLLSVYGENRMPTFPNTPTLIEQGYNIKAFAMLAMIGPKNLPSSVVETLHLAFKKAMADPNVIKTREQLDQIAVYRNPQELSMLLEQTNADLGKVIAQLGLRK